MSIADELQKLEQLRQAGSLTDAEYQSAKQKILSGEPPPPRLQLGTDAESELRLWAMVVHLSLLAGFILPVIGWVAPVFIWQWKKQTLPGIDAHGKAAVNWLLSELIYACVASILAIFVVGFFLLAILFVLAVAFPVIAGIKANGGEVWKYPCSIRFFK